MPRKKTLQPEPTETFTLDDGTVVEIRDHQTREIGRGLEKKFNAEELDWQVLHGIFDDLESNDPSRVNRAKVALSSNHAMERHLSSGGYEMDERTGRRHGRSIRKKYEQMIRIVNEVKSNTP
jgi:hypothetical protein